MLTLFLFYLSSFSEVSVDILKLFLIEKGNINKFNIIFSNKKTSVISSRDHDIMK